MKMEISVEQELIGQEQAVILYNYLIEYANNHTIPSDSRTNITLYASKQNQNAQPIIEITRIPEAKKGIWLKH